NPIDLQRLAGSLDSNEIGAKAKAQLVTDLFGDTDNSNWTAEYRARGAEGLVQLYMQRMAKGIAIPSQTGGYVCRYGIRSLLGDLKYHLVFATRHAKGAVVMSDTVFNREDDYEQDVRDYKASQDHQLSLFGSTEPTKEQIFADK